MPNSALSACQTLDAGRAAIAALMDAPAVTEADIAMLRRSLPSPVTRDEADALFALDASPIAKSTGWTSFLVETVTDHVVWGARPTGVVNGAQGEWLIGRADLAHSLTAFAVLVNVLSEAHRVPLWFLAAVRARAANGWPGVDATIDAAAADLHWAA